MILYLYALYGGSVNNGIHKEQFPVHYATVDNAVELISRFGTGTILAKIDLEAAFRMAPPGWLGSPGLAMGQAASTSTHAYPLGWDLLRTSLTSSQRPCTGSSSTITMIHYLDDFLIVLAPGADQSATSVHSTPMIQQISNRSTCMVKQNPLLHIRCKCHFNTRGKLWTETLVFTALWPYRYLC